MAFVSEIDWREAYLCGQAAVTAAVGGSTDRMVALIREPGPEYRVTMGLAPLAEAAGTERLFPPEWITADGTDVVRGVSRIRRAATGTDGVSLAIGFIGGTSSSLFPNPCCSTRCRV